MATYASLHNHTCYSNVKLIDSINTVEGLMDYAYELGLPAVALTDHECLTAHIRAIKYHKKKYADKNLKLILGNEIYITREDLCKEIHQAGEKFYHCILLAKDAEGHKQLRELSSRAWERSYMMFIMRTPTYLSDLEEIVGANPGHLICTTACLGSMPGTWFQNGRVDKIPQYLEWMKGLFGDDFYIELQPSDNADQIRYNKWMIDHYWDDYNFIVATDSHYLKKEERQLHKDFLQSKDGGDNREVDEFYSGAYMMSPVEILQYMQEYVEYEKIETMFNNTLLIANKCSCEYDLFHNQIVPRIQYEWSNRDAEAYEALRDSIDPEKYPNVYRYFSNDASDSDMYLAYLIAEGYYSGKIDPSEEYIARLDEELYHIYNISIKKEQPLSDYFNTMARIMEVVWNEGDSIVGPGRGSGCGSLVNYLVGITQLDPLRQELKMPFWRFMHESKIELPDIDFDTEAAKRTKIFNAVSRYFNSINSEVINVCTVGTLGTKSAIRTAGKGLAIEDAVINYIVSLVPTERGKDWTLDQCMLGDAEHPKIQNFIVQMKQFPELWNLSKRIEGLVTNLSVHASGVLILNGSVTTHNSVMKTSRGVRVTCWDLHDSEEAGALKYDFLTVEALDKIRTCLNLLLEDHLIEWQGSLQSTYNKYLLPANLDYTSPEMWELAANGRIIELFQFDTAQGSKAVRLIQPNSIRDLAAGNSVMRLMCDGEQPLDIFVRHKKNIDEWYAEMERWGLNSDEIALMRKYLDNVYGVAGSQEIVMQLSMDPKISNFTVAEANKLRKGIAKKNPQVIEETRQLFFNKGMANGTSDALLSYIWDRQIGMSLGYSFSDLHTVAYSTIALQEMNLAYYYPMIYWNCACLTVNANAINESDYENLLEEEIMDITEEEDKKKKSKVNYDKIAAAIGKFKGTLEIKAPNINKSKMGFVPNVEDNTILFGIKGISLVGDDIVNQIIARRPFTSVKDFVTRMREDNKTLIAKNKVINLIKAGCFDELEGKPREVILREYISSLVERKSRLTLQNFPALIKYDLVPDDYKHERNVFKFTKEIRKRKDGNGFYNLDDEEGILEAWYVMHIHKQPVVLDGVPKIRMTEWDAYYESAMNKVRPWLKANAEKLIDDIYNIEWNAEWNKYCQGDQLQWELDSLNFYHSGHPLAGCGITEDVESINDLVENDFDGHFMIRGAMVPKMKLHTIMGTVLVKDKKANIIVLSTPDGVIKVKLYKASFARFDKVVEDEEGNILEDSFLEKGTHLLITGILRDEMFIPKIYKGVKGDTIQRIILNADNSFNRIVEKD